MTNCINIFSNKLFDNSHKQIVFINNYEVKNVYSSIKLNLRNVFMKFGWN